ncbi:MAG: hypothetical protein U0Y10_08855 [Spirosomataceae bacterium]
MKTRLFVLFITLLIFSCTKQDEAVMPDLQNLKLEKDLGNLFDYTHRNLEILGKAVLISSENFNFRQKVYQEIERKFDGDFNVLIETLDNDNVDFDLAQNVSNVISTNNSRVTPDEVINAFKNIEGKNYYPQVYIPFYEELKAKRIIGTKEPVLIIHDGQTKDVFEGFSYKSGVLQKNNQKVDENYAKTNEVWVISLNERVSNSELASTSSSKPARLAGTPYDYVVWDRIKVTCYKESWLGGGSEVCIQAIIANIDGYITYQTSLGWKTIEYFVLPYNVWGGSLNIRDFTRSEVSRGAVITDIFSAFTYVSNDPTLTIPSFYANGGTPGSHFWYVIYEDDNWPVGTRYKDVTSAAGRTYTFAYRSADDEYDSGVMNAYSNSPTGVDQYTVANGCIEFKTKVKK